MLAVFNHDKESKEITVCAAVYNKDGKQIGITTVTVNLTPGRNSVTITGTRYPDAETAKFFFIDSNGRPVCQELKLSS